MAGYTGISRVSDAYTPTVPRAENRPRFPTLVPLFVGLTGFLKGTYPILVALIPTGRRTLSDIMSRRVGGLALGLTSLARDALTPNAAFCSR